jgi:hypothetical protein
MDGPCISTRPEHLKQKNKESRVSDHSTRGEENDAKCKCQQCGYRV